MTSVVASSSPQSSTLGVEESSGPDGSDLDVERRLSEEISGFLDTGDNESCVIGAADGELLSCAADAGNDAERGGV